MARNIISLHVRNKMFLSGLVDSNDGGGGQGNGAN